MSDNRFVITAFGAVSTDLREKRDFPAGERRDILISEEKQKRFLGARPVVPSFDILDSAKLFNLDRDGALQALRLSCQETTAELLRTTVGRDYLLIQTVNTLDDMNVVLNTLSTRLREMWGLHYPELGNKEADNEKFTRKVAEGVESTETIGISLSGEDIRTIKELAGKVLELFEEKARIEKFVENLSKELAPKATEAAGGSLAARIIAKAGSMERLAFMPSSTVQVLGAEKALFKHLTRGVPCPKHGLIFQHPTIQSAPKNKRGGAARRLAAKISIAARVDYFEAKERSEGLLTANQ